MKVALKSLGCRLNEAELEHWAAGFGARGHQLVEVTDRADLVVINTCAVTAEAVKKSRQLIRRTQRHNATAKLVVSGCYASLQPREAGQLPGVDLVVGNPDKERLVDIVTSTFAEEFAEELAVDTMPVAATEPGVNALFARGRNRAFIKVQDGCRHKCTFCIVTVARGAERSRPAPAVVDEINRVHADGVLEVILTGVHIGGYGPESGTDLAGLLKTLLAETDIPRIRLGSLEPWNIPDAFFTLFENPRLMPHLHLPLQSGSDTVLRRMGRRCKQAEFARLTGTLKEHVPDLNITTDIIAGFPGETASEWQQTLDFCRESKFAHIHVFPYSARAGTYAATLPEQVPAAIKKQRCRELCRLGQQLKHDYMRQQLGRRFAVLVENDTGELNGQQVYFGYSPNYLRCAIPASGNAPRPNSIIEVQAEDYAARNAVLIAMPGSAGTTRRPRSLLPDAPGRHAPS